MKTKRTFVFALLAASASWPSLLAQTTTPAATSPKLEDEVYQLSPFEVTAEEDTGYQATQTLAGTRIRAAQGVVLVLVEEEGSLAFGAGPHACPGERIALEIAATALRVLRDLGLLQAWGPVRGYRPLPNARIPVFS